jgi:hypothetical protein
MLNRKANASQHETRLLLERKEAEIVQLRERCSALSQQLHASLRSAAGGGGGAAEKRRHHPLSPHAINVREVELGGGSSASGSSGGKRTIATHSRERIGRNASMATRRVLDDLVRTQQRTEDPDHRGQQLPAVVQRVLEMFQNPTLHMDYLNSNLFANDILKLTKAVKSTLEREPRVVFLQSPCYVFGDIHGNLACRSRPGISCSWEITWIGA